MTRRAISGEIEARIAAGSSFSAEELRDWMNAQDLESLGAVFDLVYSHGKLIEEMPTMGDIVEFTLRFLEGCLRENPQNGVYAYSRYIAAHSLVRWYRSMRRDEAVPPEVLGRARELLRTLYKQGDPELREAIVNGALEHLFEDPEIREDFREWKADPELRKAYDQALEWSASSR